jgi:endonuclease/exonuclease/phosphatase family metal-dependent hydrolase
MNRVQILDLNIWNYNEPWEARRERIIDLIRSTLPDVVALQEIRGRDWGLDVRHQADQILARLPGYSSVWEPAHYWQPGYDHNEGRLEWEGLAILSAHPLVDRAVARLSRDAQDERDSFQRLVLGAQVQTPSGPFWVFDTHFPLSAAARTRVAGEALRFVRNRAGEIPFVFTGDLNAEPQDLPIRYLTGAAQIDGQEGDLVDAWTIHHAGEPGYTFPAWGPSKRIDYVFVPAEVRVAEIEVLGSVSSRETVSPSDHCALLATLEAGR